MRVTIVTMLMIAAPAAAQSPVSHLAPGPPFEGRGRPIPTDTGVLLVTETSTEHFERGMTEPAWRIEQGGGRNAVTVLGDRVLIGYPDRTSIVDARSGAELVSVPYPASRLWWRGAARCGDLLVLHARIYAAVVEGTTVLWSRRVADSLHAVCDGRNVFLFEQDEIYAVDARTGESRWQMDVPYGHAYLDGERLVVLTRTDEMLLIASDTGVELARHPLGRWTSSRLARGVLYVSTEDRLSARTVPEGRIIFDRPRGASFMIGVGSDAVYTCDQYGELRAHDLGTGDVLWRWFFPWCRDSGRTALVVLSGDALFDISGRRSDARAPRWFERGTVPVPQNSVLVHGRCIRRGRRRIHFGARTVYSNADGTFRVRLRGRGTVAVLADVRHNEDTGVCEIDLERGGRQHLLIEIDRVYEE